MSEDKETNKHTGGFVTGEYAINSQNKGFILPGDVAQKLLSAIKEECPDGIPLDKEKIFIYEEMLPNIRLLAWECPVCHIGIRGDVEVCPNCLKQKGVKTPNDHMLVFDKDKPVFVHEGKVDLSPQIGGITPDEE